MTIPERESRFDENYDGPECINCNLPMPEAFATRSSSSMIEVINRDSQGTIQVVESWPICPDCAASNPASVLAYVRFALS